MSERTQKLLTLRGRTDHDLIVIVDKELARGLALVDSATTRTSPSFSRAAKAHETATALLPRISSLGAAERLRIQAMADELQRRLNEAPASAAIRSFPDSVAS